MAARSTVTQSEEQKITQSKTGLRALGLCALVLGLIAFGVSNAQAETGAKWRVNGADVGSLAPSLVITELENKTGSLLFVTKGGTHVLILCTDLDWDVLVQIVGGGVVILGRVVLPGCRILLNEKVASNCQVHSPSKPNGEILSERINGSINLDVGNDLVKFTPENAAGATSKLLAVIELGELCAIGESINIETTELGEGLWVKDIGGNTGFLTESTTHLVVEGLSKLLALGQPAKLIGSAVVALGGAHSGLKWSGVPG